MRRLLAFSLLACAACLDAVGLSAQNQAAAQDVAITNARIVVGNGQVVESGTIIVRGGKIATVQAGAAPTQGLLVIDARGMSAMPGDIDGHKHLNNNPDINGQLQSLLEAGDTTVLIGGGQADANIALREFVESGKANGPRLIPSGQIIGPNSARYVGMESEIGTLEVGKRADIILLDGDPTSSIYEMLKTRVVLKDGRIVVDQRATPTTR